MSDSLLVMPGDLLQSTCGKRFWSTVLVYDSPDNKYAFDYSLERDVYDVALFVVASVEGRITTVPSTIHRCFVVSPRLIGWAFCTTAASLENATVHLLERPETP